jgi:hypothetical protein
VRDEPAGDAQFGLQLFSGSIIVLLHDRVERDRRLVGDQRVGPGVLRRRGLSCPDR